MWWCGGVCVQAARCSLLSPPFLSHFFSLLPLSFLSPPFLSSFSPLPSSLLSLLSPSPLLSLPFLPLSFLSPLLPLSFLSPPFLSLPPFLSPFSHSLLLSFSSSLSSVLTFVMLAMLIPKCARCSASFGSSTISSSSYECTSAPLGVMVPSLTASGYFASA